MIRRQLFQKREGQVNMIGRQLAIKLKEKSGTSSFGDLFCLSHKLQMNGFKLLLVKVFILFVNQYMKRVFNKLFL